MQPEARDAAHLWDMLEAGRRVREFTAGMDFARYLLDRKVQAAVERCIEIIGEAARRVSPGFQKAHAEIPWRKIIALRNVLAHEYGEVLQERLWIVATVNVPELVSNLDRLIPPPPPEVPE